MTIGKKSKEGERNTMEKKTEKEKYIKDWGEQRGKNQS